MKGILLCGGYGTRLHPMTKVTNKHLLPVYDRPIIYYPIQTLVKAGIDKIMLVTGGESVGDFLRLLGNGRDLGVKELQYTYQDKVGGIAHALRLAEDFANSDNILVMLGDNIATADLSKNVKEFDREGFGAKVFLQEVPDPERYGVAEIQSGRLTKITEKPKNPKTKLAVTGLYMYNSSVWDYLKIIKPSARGELEITDVNNWYIEQGLMEWDILEGYWIDCGTFDAMLEASNYMAKNKEK